MTLLELAQEALKLKANFNPFPKMMTFCEVSLLCKGTHGEQEDRSGLL